METMDDVADVVSKALSRAYSLGQLFWQQADSESHIQNRKSYDTDLKFQALVDATRATVLSHNASLSGRDEVTTK